MKAFSVDNILDSVRDVIIVGRRDLTFTNAKAIDEADGQSITWIKSITPMQLERIRQSKAGFVVGEKGLAEEEDLLQARCLVLSDYPRLTFSRILNALFVEPETAGIHPSAVIDPRAEIADDVYIGPHTCIGMASVGSGTRIHGNCFIYDRVTIGKEVTISAGCTIGSAGFGYVKNESGTYEAFPQLGGVQIRDNVDIGANTTIDRGTLSDTIIHEGVKIDNLVHVAHNVVIGKNSIITAGTTISGSVTLGEGVWVSPSASIINQVRIGDDATLGIGGVAMKSIPAGETWNGSPARPVGEYIRLQRFLKKQGR